MQQFDHHWQGMLAEAGKQQRFMDKLAATAVADYRSAGGEIFCGNGCSACCTLAVNCTAVEAFLVAEKLNVRQKTVLAAYVSNLKERVARVADLKSYLRLHRQELGGCPFLAGDSCGVYEARPISCRALLATKDSRWCGADFSALSSSEKQAFMESLDRKAVAFPMHYLAATQDTGQKLEEQAAMQMLQKYGFSLYGNMPVLVYLFTECDLLDSLGKDADTVLAVVAAAGLDSPFLLQVDRL